MSVKFQIEEGSSPTPISSDQNTGGNERGAKLNTRRPTGWSNIKSSWMSREKQQQHQHDKEAGSVKSSCSSHDTDTNKGEANNRSWTWNIDRLWRAVNPFHRLSKPTTEDGRVASEVIEQESGEIKCFEAKTGEASGRMETRKKRTSILIGYWTLMFGGPPSIPKSDQDEAPKEEEEEKVPHIFERERFYSVTSLDRNEDDLTSYTQLEGTAKKKSLKWATDLMVETHHDDFFDARSIAFDYAMGDITVSEKFFPLTVATMTTPDGKPTTKFEMKRLKPEQIYTIRTTSAVGEFGAYYSAGEGKDMNPVTIKVYRPKIFPQHSAAIERQLLREPNKPWCIPLLLRSFRFEFQNVLVLENMNAHSMMTCLRSNLRLELNDARVYLCEMVLAVSFLHSKKVIHRSLTLDSFWIQPSGHLKLTDYSSCVLGGNVYQLSKRKVTNYTAPELLTRGYYQKDVDIWALGVMLFRMVSGMMPFSASSPKMLKSQIREKEELYSKLFDMDLADLCSRMLHKDPKDRFAHGEPTFAAFMQNAPFVNMNWEKLFDHPFQPARLRVGQPPDTVMSRKSSLNLRVLDLQASSDGGQAVRLKKKPLRFKEITTKSATSLFGEDHLLEGRENMKEPKWSQTSLLSNDDIED